MELCQGYLRVLSGPDMCIDSFKSPYSLLLLSIVLCSIRISGLSLHLFFSLPTESTEIDFIVYLHRRQIMFPSRFHSISAWNGTIYTSWSCLVSLLWSYVFVHIDNLLMVTCITHFVVWDFFLSEKQYNMTVLSSWYF